MRHTITILVENEFGVLTRVAGLFSARGYNIESLNVAPTLDQTVSRMTLVTRGDEHVIEQIKKQLNKLIPVIKVEDISHVVHVEREILLLKTEHNTEILQLAKQYKATVIDDSNEDYLIIELTCKAGQVQEFLTHIEPHGVIAIARSGPVGMRRDARAFAINS